MALMRVATFGNSGVGGVFLARHLTSLVSRYEVSVSVNTEKLTKIERNRFIKAFQDGFIKASPKSRTATIYKMICAQCGIVPLIFHASKGSTRYGLNSYLGMGLGNKAGEFEQRLKAIAEIAGAAASPRLRSSLVYAYKEQTLFHYPARAGMTPEAFIRTVGEEFFPVRNPEACVAALKFVQENQPINFTASKC